MSREIVAVLRQNWILNEKFIDIHLTWTNLERNREKEKNRINHKPNLLLFNDKYLNRRSSVITLSVFFFLIILRSIKAFAWISRQSSICELFAHLCDIYTHVYGNTNSTHFGIQVENSCSPKETLFCGYYCRRHSTSSIFNTPKRNVLSL